MVEDLAQKKKICSGNRSSAMRLMNQFEEASAVTGGQVIEKLLQWKVSLTEKLQMLKALNNEILVLVDDDAVEDEIKQADVFSKRLQQSIINVEQLIASKSLTGTATHRSTSTPSTSDTADTTVPSIPRVSDVNCRVKLPKLVLKTFNGDLTKWETFWSTFESSIHLHPTLSAVDKFTYLNSLLEGPAMRAVAGLKLSAGNYTEAIDTLKKIWKQAANHLSTYGHLVRTRICCISNQYQGSPLSVRPSRISSQET